MKQRLSRLRIFFWTTPPSCPASRSGYPSGLVLHHHEVPFSFHFKFHLTFSCKMEAAVDVHRRPVIPNRWWNRLFRPRNDVRELSSSFHPSAGVRQCLSAHGLDANILKKFLEIEFGRDQFCMEQMVLVSIPTNDKVLSENALY